MSTGQPVFGADERVESAPQLPAELVAKLKDKSAAQQTAIIIDYYSTREKAIIKQAKEAIRTQTPVREEGTTVRIERSLDTPPVVQPGELDGARSTLIAAAKVQAARDKKYWDRFLPDIEKIMANMTPEYRVNFEYWETAYYNLVGMNKALLDTEEKAAEARAVQLTAERASAGAETPAIVAPLPSTVTGKILPGLGISEKQYRDAQTNIDKGVWPLTFD